ncbi:succinyltransferase [Corynebacterium sphenisci]|uniref:succinyltransferase n=1 Tax=Corynebacterium sphenisci TaxID=191493 RepID=UPI0026E078E5|nr:succinyltransferase [Corynebacterium sphenisci]MDO5731576.1 succinyltransferase [Corynebacterium sphenisci]
MLTQGASAIGIANIAMDGTVLDTWYPAPRLDEAVADSGTVRLGAQDVTPQLLRQVLLDEDRRVEQVAVRTRIADLSAPPVDAHDAYLRLHLLSHRVVAPFDLAMDEVFDMLNTVAWTNKGPCLPTGFENVRTHLRTRGLIHVYAIDRMPRMVDYVLPDHVRIAEAERVRLGAYLAPGTSVLREGFVSLNSGSLGPCKIEGRLSSSVTLGAGTKIGLAGIVTARHDERGRRIPLRIGERCHIAICAGTIGVDLGDDCVVEQNIIIDPATPVDIVEEGRRVSAWELAGRDRMRFYRDPDHPAVCMRPAEGPAPRIDAEPID